MTLRRSEWAFIGYFAYTTAVSFFRPVTLQTCLVNCGVVLLIVSLAHKDWRLRDWLPIPLIYLSYREIGWFALPMTNHDMERGWMHWDKIILIDLGLRAAIESLGALLPAILEISYMLVSPIAFFGLAVLYAYGHRERADIFLFHFTMGLFISYSLYPLFPSEPPRTIFTGEYAPLIDTIFREWNWEILAANGIHTSVFPSAHVSGAIAAAVGLCRALPEHPWAGRTLSGLAFLITVATIYGRYHYAVDAAAGIVVAIVACCIANLIARPRKLSW